LVVGILHPGEMGAAVGVALRGNGHDVLWASQGRSPETVRRAGESGLRDVVSIGALLAEADVVFSIVPPHAASAVAADAVGLVGLFVDANAVSPATAGGLPPARLVDGGLIGPPPVEPGTTRLYLSGDEAETVAALFAGSPLEARVLEGGVGAASALKMTYAAWSKGTAALVLAIRDVAQANGVEGPLFAEWNESAPELPSRLARAEQSAETKGWRWIGELEQIADTFAEAGQPDGFHRAAAQVYRERETR
jgi:3-hydroxyisobutyrate dehydrogenase-like beta-hydroxyacid dehydrogenase